MNLQDPISSLMTSNLVIVSPDDNLSKVKDLFDTYNIQHLPVLENERFVGLLSKTDYLYYAHPLLNQNSENISGKFSVKDAMVKRVISISSWQPIESALEIFSDKKFHALPVIDHGELVGILTTHDILFRLLHPVKATS